MMLPAPARDLDTWTEKKITTTQSDPFFIEAKNCHKDITVRGELCVRVKLSPSSLTQKMLLYSYKEDIKQNFIREQKT